MLPLGKLRSEVLNEILKDIPSSDSKVIIGPREGFDSAVIEYDEENYLIVATDPVLGVPKEHFGFFTYHFASSDVAVFGAKPRWLIVNLLLPHGTTKGELKETMKELNEECRKYETSIVGGHTGVYTTIKDITATTTAMGIVPKEELKLPLAKPGDEIVITKGVGIEFAVGTAWFKEKELRKRLSAEDVRTLKEMYSLETVVGDAKIARPFVRGMHDATEGGLTALHEIADNSNVGFEIYMESIPISPPVKKVLDIYEVDPLTISSTGTLIAITPPENVEALIKTLHVAGIPAFRIGRFTEKKERLLIRDKDVEEFPHFKGDAYAELY
ncbi:hydrogenase assembly protein HupF [Thermococci archaeon]|nr:MAG: hydrogenase assembly protein HupF [Thermococci archaeon]